MAGWSNEAKSAANTARTVLCNGGFLRLYGAGYTPLLVEIQLPNPAFQADVNGTSVSNAVPSGSALADGSIATCRIYRSDGTSIVAFGTVTETGDGGDVELDSLSVTTGQTVAVAPITFIQG
jgi:hypothetical protein